MGSAVSSVAANTRYAVSKVARGAFAACGPGVRRKTRAPARRARAIVRDGCREAAAMLNGSAFAARVLALPKEPRRAGEAVGGCVAHIAGALTDAGALSKCGAPVGAVLGGAARTCGVRQRTVGVGTRAAICPSVE